MFTRQINTEADLIDLISHPDARREIVEMFHRLRAARAAGNRTLPPQAADAVVDAHNRAAKVAGAMVDAVTAMHATLHELVQDVSGLRAQLAAMRQQTAACSYGPAESYSASCGSGAGDGQGSIPFPTKSETVVVQAEEPRPMFAEFSPLAQTTLSMLGVTTWQQAAQMSVQRILDLTDSRIIAQEIRDKLAAKGIAIADNHTAPAARKGKR